MEPNVHYALHDSDATPPTWAARVRLTPELLDKLRQTPEEVLLQLNVATTDGNAKSCSSNKRDPGINHVCAFRRSLEGKVAGGYSIYKTGAIHQKLLVQRLLDNTEKDRIKDRHAKSVLASKSRSSKLIDSDLGKPAKRQRLLPKRLSIPITKKSVGPATADHKRKWLLPSALTEEKARETKENIEKGVEVESEVQVFVEDRKTAENDSLEQDISTTTDVDGVYTDVARNVEFHGLFSSDSDDEDRIVSKDHMLQTEEKQATSELKPKQSIAICKESGESGIASFTKENIEAARSNVDARAQFKESSKATSTTIKVMQLIGENKSASQGGQSGETRKSYTLKPPKPTTSDVEVKRARVRSALVSDRVKKSRLPDLTFFPSAVGDICHRLAHYHGRSVILDEDDYNSFTETHEQFLHDWEVLDKAYSIEIIKTEGVHLQSRETNHEELNASTQALSSKKEGLLFVRDAMTSIQKILDSIQTSIDRYDLKK